MTTNPKDIEALSTWLDGELSTEESARLSARLQNDTALAEIERDLRRVDTAHRHAMKAELDTASLAAAQTIKTAFAKRRNRSIRGNMLRWAAPIAASLLVVVGAGAWVQSQFAEAEVARNLEITQMVEATVQNALETAISGSEIVVGLPDASFDMRIVPTRTYRSTSNHWCREFKERVVKDGETLMRTGIACREPSGIWREVSASDSDAI